MRGGRIEGIDDALLEALATDRSSLRSIAARFGKRVIDLAAIVSEPSAQAALSSLGALAERRAALRLAHARTAAADALRRLALDGESKETARKACIDLLRLPGDGGAGRSAGVEAGDRGLAASARLDDALARWLERVAREEERGSSRDGGGGGKGAADGSGVG